MSPYKIRRLYNVHITSELNLLTLIIIVGKYPKRLIASDRFSHNFMSPDSWLGMDRILNGLEHAVDLFQSSTIMR